LSAAPSSPLEQDREAAAGFFLTAVFVLSGWLDLALFGNAAARQHLDDRPCRTCPADEWIVQAKNLDSLLAS
jgi:hypothetical protein